MTNDYPSKSCPHGRCIDHQPEPHTRPIWTKTKPTRNSNLFLAVAAISTVIWIVSLEALQAAGDKADEVYSSQMGKLLDEARRKGYGAYDRLRGSPSFACNEYYRAAHRAEYLYYDRRIEEQWQKKVALFASFEAWVALLGIAFWARRFSFCCWRPRRRLKEIVRLESYCGACGRVLKRWSRVEKVFCERCYCCGRT